MEKRILKCVYLRYPEQKISTIHSANSQIIQITTREVSVVSLRHGNLDFNFDVDHAANNNRHIVEKDNVS